LAKRKYKVGVVSLGCPKNLVDSEVILGLLKREGYKITNLEQSAQILIVNTCSFIKEARDESQRVISKLLKQKEDGDLKALIISGCLVQLHKERIVKLFPQADAFVGCGEFHRIEEIIRGALGKEKPLLVNEPKFLYDHQTPRLLSTPFFTSYVKIAEGCSNYCSYCLIPQLRGSYRSRKIESVIEEVKALTDRGVKEVNLIAQDTTYYGKDLYQEYKLAELIKKLVKIDKVKWIRLLYTHPSHLNAALLEVIEKGKKVCKYLDLPLQHIDSRILKLMNRPAKERVCELINKIRRLSPKISLRTSLIVGFPGEREKDFKALLEFVKEIRFDKLGAFIYSREPGTKAFNFKGHLPYKVKRERYQRLMELQQEISYQINKSLIGKTLNVLIERKKDSMLIGRSERDAPNVDGLVYVRGKAKIGDIVKVKITKAYEYDLEGEIR